MFVFQGTDFASLAHIRTDRAIKAGNLKSKVIFNDIPSHASQSRTNLWLVLHGLKATKNGLRVTNRNKAKVIIPWNLVKLPEHTGRMIDAGAKVPLASAWINPIFAVETRLV
jgi:hypothetical protein